MEKKWIDIWIQTSSKQIFHFDYKFQKGVFQWCLSIHKVHIENGRCFIESAFFHEQEPSICGFCQAKNRFLSLLPIYLNNNYLWICVFRKEAAVLYHLLKIYESSWHYTGCSYSRKDFWLYQSYLFAFRFQDQGLTVLVEFKAQ